MKHILSILMVLLIAGFCTAHGQTAGVSPVMTSAAEADSDLVKTPPPVIDVDIHVIAFVTIERPYSHADLYYRFQVDNGEWSEWTILDGNNLSFSEIGTYRLEAYAVAEGEIESDIAAVTFTIIEIPETNAPLINAIAGDQSYTVVITNTDESPVFICYKVWLDGNRWDYGEYEEPLVFTEFGEYTVWASATVTGKLESSYVSIRFTLDENTTRTVADAPEIMVDQAEDMTSATVTVTAEDGAIVYYRYRFDNGEWSEWMIYRDQITFNEFGTYSVEAYAIVGNSASDPVTVDFSLDENARPVKGDVNNDGIVTPVDISALIDYMMGEAAGDTDEYDADVNGDGMVTPIDISVLIDYLLNGMWPGKVYTVNGVEFTMIPVEGGTFMMGGTEEQGSDADYNERPAHRVTLSSYSIGLTEVTQELWEAVMGRNASWFNGDIFGTNLQRPVEYVTWNDCLTPSYRHIDLGLRLAL